LNGIRAALLGWGVVALAAMQVPAGAADHTVHLVTEDEQGRFQFQPAIVYADVGDTVRFVPDDDMHAVKSVPGMLPEGAVPWRGRMGETISVRLDRPGVYGVKCRSGYELGMVGLIVVGSDPPNWQQAQAVRHPARASQTFAGLFDEAGCHLRLPECKH
jgi:pseudoazurin